MFYKEMFLAILIVCWLNLRNPQTIEPRIINDNAGVLVVEAQKSSPLKEPTSKISIGLSGRNLTIKTYQC